MIETVGPRRSFPTWRTEWDSLATHIDLARLTATRGRFRIRRTLDRIRSPRRIVATSLAILFFLLYLLNGIFILSSREPADPQNLRLWLSGGMVIYAVYHCARCAWSRTVSDLELTAAEELWLGGAPLQRSSLAVYHVGTLVIPALLKTLLLTVVLAMDVNHVGLLVAGMFSSLVLLEIVRLIVARWTAGFDSRRRHQFRVAVTVIASALALQVIARVIAMTPIGSPTWMYVLNGFRGLGQTAASDFIQWAALPWTAAAHLAVTEAYQLLTCVQLLSVAIVMPLAIALMVKVDRWSSLATERRARANLAAGNYQTRQSEAETRRCRVPNRFRERIEQILPDQAADAMAIMSRQWVSVARYRRSIILSFAVPMVLCLSPLMTGQQTDQWFFVVGGIALCTMLLAPPALRIDFRRDLKRMLLLRSLPVKPLSMVVGQLAIPVLITWVYQWLTIAVAAFVTTPGLGQACLWTGLLNALALFTFAAENAMFLAYPHHEHSEGVAMMVRTKLTFLGKATVMGLALGLLVGWALLCRGHLPESWVTPVFVIGALIASWSAAVVALIAAKLCWRRFDLAYDAPPQ